MRLGGYSRIQRLIVYSFCFSFLLISWPKPVAANPAVGLLVRVIAQTVTKRASTRAATEVAAKQAVTKYPLTEAAMQETIRRQAAAEAAATARAMSRELASRAARVPTNSALRTAGQVTWAGVNVVGGAVTVSELIDAFRSDNLKVATDGVSLGNGKYEVRVGGRTQIVDFEPSPDLPVILYGSSFSGADSGSVITPSRPVAVQGLPLNHPEKEFFPVPFGVVKSVAFDHGRATYSIDIRDDIGDYYFIEDDRMSSIQNAMIFKAVKEFERQYQPRIYEAKGDNVTFDYVDTSYTLDVLDFIPKEGTLFPSYPGVYTHISGAVTSYDAVIPAILHTKKLKSDYHPCEYITVSEIVNDKPVETNKYMCTPPNDKDYVISDSRISERVYLSLNTDYKGDYFTKKNESNLIKSVSGNELAHILRDKPLDNNVVADLINDLLYDAAAQDNYDGILLNDDDYIKESEISDALKKLGVDKLTVSDLFSPYQNIEINSSSNETNINHGGGSGDITVDAKVDLGENPNIKSPDLDAPPTGKEIIQPIRDSMPFLSDFKIGSRNAACPVADISFSLFGVNVDETIDSHCDMIEKNRKLIELIASLVWAFAALRMILSA
ncbi:hypothetical protein XBO1_1300108 [Xenorhabdus bovienii str. oregonense]|uniref:Uncharacterized protein n=1 Tax=Xenorhabdus bovienii str. oregonense TaxID=1398202 RepID=A0A077P134_XENBV|nr:hypothetical protein [Xenorhabdus bovienii]CDH04534.1 hypothetical protein XBO1_1300108 [Xenorhabdus bovienii str. oregonense]